MKLNVDLSALQACADQMMDPAQAQAFRLQSEDAWLELDMLSQTEALKQLRDGWDYDAVLRRCRDWLAEIEAEAEADAENAIMHDDSDHIW